MEIRSSFLTYFEPSIGQEEIDEVINTLKSGWLTTSLKTKQFEEEFARYIGVKHAIGLTSCTAGLHLALLAHGIGPGDEVLVPSFTFAATVNVIIHVGATPIFVDIQNNSYCLDVEDARKKITSKTKAILPVHYAGHPADIDSITQLAQEKGLIIIEDAAHAVGTSYKGKKIGALGNTTCYSFYATKNMTTGEGGMLTTNDDQIAEKVRLLRLHGMSKDAWKRYENSGSWYYEIETAGWKYNMTDVQASLGIHQLRKLDGFIQRRAQLADLYGKELGKIASITLPPVQGDVGHAWHLYPILLRGANRNVFIELMKEKNIGTSVHFIPNHLQPFYRKVLGTKEGDLPVTEEIYNGIVSLPLYPKMTVDDVNYVVQVIKEIVENIRERNA